MPGLLKDDIANPYELFMENPLEAEIVIRDLFSQHVKPNLSENDQADLAFLGFRGDYAILRSSTLTEDSLCFKPMVRWFQFYLPEIKGAIIV